MASGVENESNLEQGVETTPTEESAPEQAHDEIGRVRKGANIARRRNVLGRGLSALMSSSVVPVSLGRNEPFTPAPAPRPGPLPQPQLAEQAPRAQENEVKNPFLSPTPVHPSPSVADAGAEHQVMETAAAGTANNTLRFVPIGQLIPNRSQPRQHFSPDELERLAASIKESGLLQPLVVRELGPDRYEIVAGERRFRAATEVGIEHIPVVVRDLSDRETLEIGIIENVQRADLNPVEEALAYQRLIQEFGASQGEIAATVGRDRTSIANSLRLLKLPAEIQQLLVTGRITAGHGRALLMLQQEEDQRCLAEQIEREQLSVRATEAMVSEYAAQLTPAGVPKERPELSAARALKTPAVASLEDRLRQALGTKVSLLVKRSGKGELRVSFFSQAELERILERLGA